MSVELAPPPQMTDQQLDPIQEGVDHGPYMPTNHPFEQTDRHREAVGEAYDSGRLDYEHFVDLNAALDEQEEKIQLARIQEHFQGIAPDNQALVEQHRPVDTRAA